MNIPAAIIKKRYPRWLSEKQLAVMSPEQHERVAPEDFAMFLKEEGLSEEPIPAEGAVPQVDGPATQEDQSAAPAPVLDFSEHAQRQNTVISRSGSKKGR